MRWIDWLFPSATCILCGRATRDVPPWTCAACLRRLPLVVPPVCASCGRPWRSLETSICGRCEEQPPPFEWAVHLAVYDGSMESHIARLKFEGRRAIARPLGALLGEVVTQGRRLPTAAVVVPVPLHASRERERGYNQAALLGRALAERLDRPYLAGVLRRVRDTETQAKLSLPERRRNLRGAFRTVRPAAVRGRTVVLVDDVYTSGTTCREAALALLRAGAEAVGVACAAVAVIDTDLTRTP